jgi:hypothetical protein
MNFWFLHNAGKFFTNCIIINFWKGRCSKELVNSYQYQPKMSQRPIINVCRYKLSFDVEWLAMLSEQGNATPIRGYTRSNVCTVLCRLRHCHGEFNCISSRDACFYSPYIQPSIGWALRRNFTKKVRKPENAWLWDASLQRHGEMQVPVEKDNKQNDKAQTIRIQRRQLPKVTSF